MPTLKRPPLGVISVRAATAHEAEPAARYMIDAPTVLALPHRYRDGGRSGP